MTLEQVLWEINTLDLRADIFGKGEILCEILTGTPAFLGHSTRAMVQQAAEGNLQDAFLRLDQCDVDGQNLHFCWRT